MTEEITQRLAQIEDPRLDGDIVSLGLVSEVRVEEGTAHVALALGAPHSPAEEQLVEEVRAAIDDLGYEPSLSVAIDDETPAGHLDDAPVVIAVASGKGGVGKSTVAANLAAGMSARGARVGLFDADVYGPNIPQLFGVTDEPVVATDSGAVVPVERHGVELMSIGFLVGDDDPVIWRGAMVDKTLTQLYNDVQWGEVDYLVVDLPPGTGDAQLTMLQQMPVTGAVVVTTPQSLALDDARKGLRMFDQHDTAVLGVVENMSSFVCTECGTTHDVFPGGGGETLAAESDQPLLARIPLDPAVGGAETGKPVALRADDPAAGAFDDLAERTMDRIGQLRRQSHAETRKEADSA
jgi:ATP-binding protein involved in chromosome partitioning